VTASASALVNALAVLLPAQEIVDGRVDEPEPPAWCVARAWAPFLLALSDDVLRACEERGLDVLLGADPGALPGAPRDLVELARAASAATRLPAIVSDEPALAARSVSARKRRQLPALLAAVGPMAASADRIVDVGAGSGHFTNLAADRFDRASLGIERDPARVSAANERAADRATFVELDVQLDALLDMGKHALAFEATDLAVGLHACGDLGDRLVLAAAEAGCDLALVSCCFQKIRGATRGAVSRAGAALVLQRETLGLANLTTQPVGVEAPLEAVLAARQARHALRRLLLARGLDVPPGEEMRGVNRRRAHGGLGVIARAALARRGLPPPDDAEIRRHEEDAVRRYAVIRRLALPRNMLSRLLEVAIVLDRAAALEEAGHATLVATVFDREVTPRNVGLFASHAKDRLPLSTAPPRS
jgi:SAM-dependent methyltransferase